MKNALTLIALVVTPTMAFTQGTIAIGNTGSELVRQWTSLSDSTLIPVPTGQGHVQFLAAPAGTPFTPLMSYGGLPNFPTLASFLAANPGWNAYSITAIVAPGRFVGSTVTVSPLVPGGNIEYFTVGWTGPYASYDLAYSATVFNPSSSFLGQSALRTSTTGNPTTTVPGIPSVMNATYTGMALGATCLGSFWGFTAQPTSQTVVLGATATFYVGANACPPPFYQWYFNGVSIPGATGSSFQISNAQLTDAGTYWVVLSNPGWGVRTSASATLTVLAAPVITSPPQSQTAEIGSAVRFHVHATSTMPLSYEWFFNSTIASTGSTTNSDLLLTNVQPSQAGAYTVVVTNIAGAVTSPPSMLSVIPPVERRIVPGLSLLGQPGSLLHLVDADALGPVPAWVSFDSVTLTNSSQWYFDLSTPLPPQRFYRAWQAGGPSVLLALDLKMVPALTMTGPVGSSVRVDYINQFGPTDTWLALDTVTLANTTQLYFDVSAPGQPPRLYRLVQVP